MSCRRGRRLGGEVSTSGRRHRHRARPPARARRSGAERRGAILAATVRILRHATGSPRSPIARVAREAGVPLAATTYYFTSKDELVGEALAILVEDEIERLRERARELGVGHPLASATPRPRSPRCSSGGGRRRRAAGEVRGLPRGGATPGPAHDAAHWQDAFTELARSSLDPRGRRRAGPPRPAARRRRRRDPRPRALRGSHGRRRPGSPAVRLEQLFALLLEG